METLVRQSRAEPAGITGISPGDLAAKLGISKKNCQHKVKAMEDKRTQYMTRWRNIRDWQLPFLGEFTGIDNETNGARRKDTKIYNGIAWDCNTIFSAGIMSGLTPPSRPWYRLNFTNDQLSEDTDLCRILDERLAILNDVLEKSNFYNVIHSCYSELAFGQAPLGIFPDARYGVHFESYPIGSYALECGPDGAVNSIMRKYRMTASQLSDKFGYDNIPYNIRQELRDGGGHTIYHNVYWFVEPNAHAHPEKRDRYNMPYTSIYWVEGSEENEFLYVGGFMEWPVPVARYTVVGNSPYGTGPGWYAEGESKSVQLLEKDMLTAVELVVKPPMTAPPDNLSRGVNLIPGGVNRSQNPEQTKPLFQIKPDLAALREQITSCEERIKRVYSADLFLMISQINTGKMTAREVIERSQEKMQQLGPVVQRLQFEFLGQIIERVYNILDRSGIFPMPEDPELMQVLAQQEIKIEYLSPLAQAQKLSGLTNIEQAIGFVGNLASLKPEVLDKVDFAEVVDKYLETVGAPAAIRRSDKEYQQIQERRAKEAQQQQQMAMAQQIAQTAAPAAQATKNFADAMNNGNPALRQVLGTDQLGIGG